MFKYFTAGYVGHPKWNEMNFGFHPDRDDSGTKISCEVNLLLDYVFGNVVA